MFIKYNSLSENKDLIINVNINNTLKIETIGNRLIFEMESPSQSVAIMLKDNNSAEKALDKLFNTLYNKAPLNNLLDLTSYIDDNNGDMKDSEYGDDFGEITMEENINDIGETL